MPFNNDSRQKSLKRRFLLILGAVTFVCILGLGLMILFWKSMLPQLEGFQRTGFGVVVIIYAFLRFARLFRKDPDEV
jgi:cytochrome c biogenesis protein CcdA